MDDNRCLDPGSAEDGVENINISDVIEVIETDLDLSQASPPRPSNMFAVPRPLDPAQIRNQAWVEVIEQPAHKALRFRYECEGRSAGSIPGESSSTENKTFPAIRVVGYRGKAVVVVSCVTRDKPYRAHPHNLVGREGCRKGVCTLEIPPETMTMTFSNLGIQCVKKKDIEAHLKVREEIRVDPFKSGFAHRNQPTSIDLNSVRLCFQVFLENEKTKKFTVALEPVVSNPIYDKKAIADLVIVKLSDCSCSVDGGRKDVVLLCEKVAKEDIQVRFFEEKNGAVTWEGLGDFQPSQVHKQHAIWFRPPRYHTLDITEPVKVNIQLRRPSDGATSEALPFEYLPLDSGRSSFWSARRGNLHKKNHLELLNSLLGNELQLLASKRKAPDSDEIDKDGVDAVKVDSEVPAYGEIKKVKPVQSDEDEKMKEIISDVTELDEIYADNQKRLQENENTLMQQQQESFDDAKTYSSLQMAFKNPVQIYEIDINDKYEDVIVNPQCPVIDVGNKRDAQPEVEKLPPLPPKRSKKVIETDICDPAPTESNSIKNLNVSSQSLNKSTHNSIHSIVLTSEQAENLLCTTNGGSPLSVSRSQSFNMHRPKSQNDLAPVKKLPPKPCSTLPNPKKRGFFSKLFGKKDKSAPSSRNTSAVQSKRNSFSSSNSLQVNSTLNRTPSNASNKSAVSIRIPLKGSLTDISSELNDLNQSTYNNNNNLVANTNGNITNDMMETDDFNLNLDLTEAEHYALYTAMAPHATQSEFDEMSSYYAPVEGGKLLTETEVMLKLANNSKT